MTTKAQRQQATANRLKAMSHPVRAQAFRLIRDKGPISPKQLAEALGLSVKDLSYHVRKLKDYRCVEEVSSRKVRSVLEHFYVATEMHMVDTEEWEELFEREPEMAEFILDDVIQCILDDYIASRRAGVVGSDKEFFVTRTPHLLDPEGIDEALKASEEYEDIINAIASRSAARRAEKGTADVPVCTTVVFFKMPRQCP